MALEVMPDTAQRRHWMSSPGEDDISTTFPNGGNWEPLLALCGKKSAPSDEWVTAQHHWVTRTIKSPSSSTWSSVTAGKYEWLTLFSRPGNTHILNPCIHLLQQHRPLILNQLHHPCRALFIHLFRPMFIFSRPIRRVHISACRTVKRSHVHAHQYYTLLDLYSVVRTCCHHLFYLK